MSQSRYPLEPDAQEMRRLVALAMERIVPHVESLASQPASDVEGARDLARSIIEPMPESGRPFEEILELLFERLVPKSFNAAGPGYLAYIPGGGIFHSAVADLLSDSFNRYIGVFAAAPALAQIEANVARWFAGIVGFGEGSGGVLTSGGSLANFTAIVTARRALLPDDFLRGTIYASDQVHHSVGKAALLAGFPQSSIRVVPSDPRFRVDTRELEAMIDRDRREGRSPFLVVASAGTTNTGAVDDLEEIARISKAQRMWMHVDGAYGAFFMMTERGRAAMRGIEKADSVTLDPHKALFLPYGTGALVVRDLDALRRAHSLHADYLPEMQTDSDLVDFCEVSPELSRGFRGLRVWLPLELLGAAPFRAALDEKLDLAAWATNELKKIEGIEIVAEPQLSIVAFRLVRPGLSPQRLNELNARLGEAANAKKRVMITGSTSFGVHFLRICVLSFRTHLDRMVMALEDIRQAVNEV